MSRARFRHFVFVTDEVPRPGQAGHLAMNHAILAWLAARGHRVTVLLTAARLPWPVLRTARVLDPGRVRIEGPGIVCVRGMIVARRPRQAAGIVARQVLAAAVPRGAASWLRARARRGAYGQVDAVLGQFIAPAASDWCAARIQALQPDAVLVDTLFRAPLLLDPRLAGCRSLVVAHDVFHLRHAALARRGYRLFPPSLTAEQEAALLRPASAVAAIQPEDARALAGLLPETRILVAAMPATLAPRPAGTATLPGRLVFLGSDSLHNVDGMRWFLAEVWPALRGLVPTTTLDVCGSVGSALGGPPPGVRLLGRVADVAPVLHRAQIGVAPLLAGSGLKIKLLDYLRHGLPVVTTAVGAAGFPADADRPLLVADDAAAMAAVLARTLYDLAGIEARALAYAGGFAADQVFAALGACLDA